MSSKKEIGYVTRGFETLPEDRQIEAMREFYKQAAEKEDWIYSLLGGKIFAQLNEEGSYTLMLAEEY